MLKRTVKTVRFSYARKEMKSMTTEEMKNELKEQLEMLKKAQKSAYNDEEYDVVAEISSKITGIIAILYQET